jgi:SSS family solute:Na+ symporter
MIVVGNAGWVGSVMVKMGLIAAPHEARDIFVTVAETICKPGVFGFVLAALSAALMSTIDTMTNATAALFIYDVYQPYIRPHASDRHYMRAARLTSAVAALLGMGIGLWFATMGADMYKLHGQFQAFVTPPIVAAVFLGAFWKRFTSAGAIAALLGGVACIWLSKFYPALVAPFAHGVTPGQDGQYSYMTAFFGLGCAAVIGVVVSLLTRPKSDDELAGLWIGTMDFGMRR